MTKNIYFPIFFISALVYLINQSKASFDLADLENGVYHKLDITRDPISLQLSNTEDLLDLEIVQLSSIFGQLYSCSYKSPAAVLANMSVEPEQPWLHVNITSLMGHFINATECFRATKGWWTYEVCPWKELVQYHDDRDTKTSSGRSLLGTYAKEYNWSISSENDDQVKKKYHSQYFENGSTCDLTQKPRSAQIQYLCQRNDHLEDGIVDIQEPETCRYVIQVHIHKLCESSVFRRSKGGHIMVGITCNPALTENNYQKYMKRAELEKQKEDEDLLRKQMEMTEGASIGEPGHSTGTIANNNPEAVTASSSKSTTDQHIADTLEKELVKAYEKLSGQPDQSVKPNGKPSGKLQDVDIEVQVVGEDDDVLGGNFEAELEKVGNLRATDVKVLRAQMVEQFESIIEETKAEIMAAEGMAPVEGEAAFNQEQAVKTLADTLDKMMDKVQGGDPRISADTVHASEQQENSVKKPAITSGVTETPTEESLTTKPIAAAEKDTADNTLQEKLDDDPFAKENLAQAIKKELEKAGLKTGDRHVEIRVIAAPSGGRRKRLGASEDNEGTAAGRQGSVLPENTGRALGQMIAAVLTSDAAIVRNAYDHQMLEENYAAKYDEFDDDVDNVKENSDTDNVQHS